uniref:Xpo1 domain-containing protein n=1 Tax=Syphacia muris TaxID=451379 RepID=A0A0N5B0K8_9BILA
MDNVDTVYHAIAVFNGADSIACGKASVWLGEFQKSVYAWTVCDRILGEKKEYNACLFAAQTMRQKLLHHMRELPPDSYLSLQESLLSHISNYGCGNQEKPTAILTQLCLALVDLYMQVPEWTDFIAKIFERFSKLPNSDTFLLLSLLKIFAEEVQSRQLRVGDNRRCIVNSELAQQTSSVLQFLSHTCSTNPSNVSLVSQALYCLSSWLYNPLVPTDELAASHLLTSVFAVLHTPDSETELFHAACECIVSVLYRVEDVKKHYNLAVTTLSACYAMTDAFKSVVSKDDSEKVQGYTRIFCELNESFLECMVRTPGEDLGNLNTLEMLLLPVSFADITVVEMSFNIWYRLSEFLYNRNEDKLNEKFKPFIERYILALYMHCQLDPEEKSVPDYEGEHEYRLKIADSIKDVVFIVGTYSCINSMMSILQSCTSSWVETEAALYIISIVIHNVLPMEDNIVPSLVKAVLKLPNDSHPALFHTAVKFFGNLVDWLEENSSYCDDCIDWLLNKAQSEVYVKVAAESLERIFEKCGPSLKKYFERLIALIPVLEQTSSKGQQIETSILSILKASASLLNGLPPSEVSSCLKLITDPQTDRLAALINSNGDILQNGSQSSQVNNENCSDSWSQLTRDPVLWIDRIAAIFRQLEPWQNQTAKFAESNSLATVPFLDTVKKVWSIMSTALYKFEKSTRIVEHLCRTIRFLIRSLGVQSIIFLEQLVGQMIDIYHRHQHSCFLYLASILVDEYGQLNEYREGLVVMLQALSEESFKLLARSSNFREHPDTIDDLYRLGIRYVQRDPSHFFLLPVCERLFECGLSALDVDHVEANRSVTKFFIESVDSLLNARKANYRDEGVEGAEKLFAKYGERLVSGCLRALIFSVTGSLRRDMAEVIFMIGKLSKEKLSEWLNKALSSLPRDIGLAATTQQLQEFHRNVLEYVFFN